MSDVDGPAPPERSASAVTPVTPAPPASTEPAELPKKWVIVGFALALFAGLCTAMLFVKAQRDAVSKAPPKGAPLAFVDVAPIAIDLNEDGVEDFAAVAHDAQAAQGALAVVAFNGKTLREVWHSEGLVGLERARLVAAGDAVIVFASTAEDGGARARAYVLQVRSGRALRDVALPAPAVNVCASGGGVFYGLTDRRVLVLDVAAGTTRDARPEEGACARAPWAGDDGAKKGRSYAVTGGKLTVAAPDGRVIGVVEGR